MSRNRRAIAWLAPPALLAAALIAPLVAGRGDLIALTTSAAFAIAALGVVILTGWAGQSSLAQVTFMGVGAYTYGRLTGDLGLPLPLAAPIAVGFTALVGAALGLPILRLRGVYVAVATLAFAQVMSSAVFGNDSLTNSQNGLGIPRPVLGPIDLREDVAVYHLAVALLLGACALLIPLRRSAFARELFALRSTEMGASVRGVNVARAKLGAFALAAAFAGMGGVTYGLLTQGLNPILFQPLESVFLFAVVVMFGSRSISAALGAGLFVGLLRVELARQVNTSAFGSNLPFLLTGLGVLAVVVGREQLRGLGARVRRARDHFRSAPTNDSSAEVVRDAA